MQQTVGQSKIATALIAARGQIRAIAKDGVNPHFRSKYASLDAILETVVPILTTHELAVVQGVTAPDRDEHGKITAFTVETMLLHASGESITSAVVMPVTKSDPQGAGGALTYGRRYGLSALLALATDEDDDGNAASRAKTAGRRMAKPPTANGRQPADTVMPLGKHKGQTLGAIDTSTLASSLQWCRDTAPQKFGQLINDIEFVLEARRDTEEAATR